MSNFILETLFDIYIADEKEKQLEEKSYLQRLEETENKLEVILKKETEERKRLIREYEEDANFLKLLEIEHAYNNGFLTGIKLSKDINELNGDISF